MCFRVLGAGGGVRSVQKFWRSRQMRNINDYILIKNYAKENTSLYLKVMQGRKLKKQHNNM